MRHYEGPRNQIGLKLDGTLQFMVYADDNSLGDNINTVKNKKFWEELIAHFSLIEHRLHRKRYVQQRPMSSQLSRLESCTVNICQFMPPECRTES
jgi:hypothetical protein